MSRIRRTSVVSALLMSAWMTLASGSWLLATGAASHPCDTPCSGCQQPLLLRAVDCCCIVAPAEPAPAGSTRQSAPPRHDSLAATAVEAPLGHWQATYRAPSAPLSFQRSAPPPARLVLRI